MRILRLFLLLLIVGAVTAVSSWTTFMLHEDIASRLRIRNFNVVAWNRQGQLMLVLHGHGIRIQNGCAIVDEPKYQAVCEVFAVQEE